MILERWDDINDATLIELCESNAPETISLDFKQQLYGSTPEDKAEFMKDVCALANSEGGDLVFGIAEAKGAAGKLMPIVDPTADRAMRKLGQILDGSVEPRVPGLQWKQVTVEGGYALILRVPKSLIGPHRYVMNNLSRFPIRNGTHIADMSYDQLRDAFGRTSTLLDQARSFRRLRLGVIPAGLWKPLPGDIPYLALHLIPIESMSGRSSMDVTEVNHRYNDLMGYRWGGAGRNFNLDGLLVWEGSTDKTVTRCAQAFRSGALEMVDAHVSSDHAGFKAIQGPMLACNVRESLGKLLKSAKASGFLGSAVVGLALHRVTNYTLYMGQVFNMHGKYLPDRSDLILPEAWVENIEGQDIDELVKPLLDVIWQSFGLESCGLYDETTGKWSPERRFH